MRCVSWLSMPDDDVVPSVPLTRRRGAGAPWRQSPLRWERTPPGAAGPTKKPRDAVAVRRISAYTDVGAAEQQQGLVDQVAAEVAQDAAARRRRPGSVANRSNADSKRGISPSSPCASSRCRVSRSESQRRFW